MNKPNINDDYTKIRNSTLEALLRSGLRASEISCWLLIYRKTIGWNKTEDQISLSQFKASLPYSKPTIFKALKVLQLYNLTQLVKSGKSSKCSNLWRIVENSSEWKLYNLTQLVKSRKRTIQPSLYRTIQPDATHKRHIKDTKQKTLTSDFPLFWNLYQKKVGYKKCSAKWMSLPMSQRAKILSAVPAYVASTPDRNFRKNPLTYLNGECWNDEIIQPETDENLKREFKELGWSKFREKYRLTYGEKKPSELDAKERQNLKHMRLFFRISNLIADE